jgi:hypothetical protein
MADTENEETVSPEVTTPKLDLNRAFNINTGVGTSQDQSRVNFYAPVAQAQGTNLVNMADQYQTTVLGVAVQDLQVEMHTVKKGFDDIRESIKVLHDMVQRLAVPSQPSSVLNNSANVKSIFSSLRNSTVAMPVTTEEEKASSRVKPPDEMAELKFLGKYKGGSKWTLYLRSFVQLADKHQWSYIKRGEVLSTVLDGLALESTEYLPREKLLDFDSLCVHLRNTFQENVTMKDLENNFTRISIKPGQLPEDFARDVMLLAIKANPTLSADLVEQKAINRFVHGLQNWRWEEQFSYHKPATLQDAIQAVNSVMDVEKRKRMAGLDVPLPKNNDTTTAVPIIKRTVSQGMQSVSSVQPVQPVAATVKNSFKRFPMRDKDGYVVDMELHKGKCFNCLSNGHMRQNCPFPKWNFKTMEPKDGLNPKNE